MRVPFKNIWISVGLLAVFALVSACSSQKGSSSSSDAGPATFVNESPAFSMTYTAGWTKGKVSSESQVLNVYTGGYKLPSMAVSIVEPESVKSPQETADGLCEYFAAKQKAVSCKALTTEEITLADGTPAVAVMVKWKHPAIMLYSYNLIAEKGGTGVSIIITDMSKIKDAYIKHALSLKIQ
ncbi:MAG: hypothetical protein GY866_18465 [Proteobacteria bacterium]|nr:hypothetical protein [Pseudomonadota bacterium]